jgi:hypothetical protein
MVPIITVVNLSFMVCWGWRYKMTSVWWEVLLLYKRDELWNTLLPWPPSEWMCKLWSIINKMLVQRIYFCSFNGHSIFPFANSGSFIISDHQRMIGTDIATGHCINVCMYCTVQHMKQSWRNTLWEGDDDDDNNNVTPLDYTTHTAKKMDHTLQKI